MALSARRSWVGGDDDAAPPPPAAPTAVVRYEWEGRFGPMVVEVRDGQAFVNGRAVKPHQDGGVPPPSST